MDIFRFNSKFNFICILIYFVFGEKNFYNINLLVDRCFLKFVCSCEFLMKLMSFLYFLGLCRRIVLIVRLLLIKFCFFFIFCLILLGRVEYLER